MEEPQVPSMGDKLIGEMLLEPRLGYALGPSDPARKVGEYGHSGLDWSLPRRKGPGRQRGEETRRVSWGWERLPSAPTPGREFASLPAMRILRPRGFSLLTVAAPL